MMCFERSLSLYPTKILYNSCDSNLLKYDLGNFLFILYTLHQALSVATMSQELICHHHRFISHELVVFFNSLLPFFCLV